MRTIPEIRARSKTFIARYRERLFFALTLLLVAALAFGLGRLSALSEREGDFMLLSPEGAEGSASKSAASSSR